MNCSIWLGAEAYSELYQSYKMENLAFILLLFLQKIQSEMFDRFKNSPLIELIALKKLKLSFH